MALIVGNVVRETSTSTGVGRMVVDGAVPGHRSFEALSDDNGGGDLERVPVTFELLDAESQPATILREIAYCKYWRGTNELERLELVWSSTGNWINWPGGVVDLAVTGLAEDILLAERNLDDLADVAAARAALGLTSIGDALATAANAAAARGTLDLGSAAVEDADTAGTASTVVKRNASGQAVVANPTAATHAANRGWSEGVFSPSGTLAAPPGTGLLLSAGAVPTGWTRQNATERLAIQLAQAAESIGTTTGSWVTDSHALTISQIPAHSHAVEHTEFEFDQNLDGTKIIASRVRDYDFVGTTMFGDTTPAGSGFGHSHGSNVKAQRVAEITKD